MGMIYLFPVTNYPPGLNPVNLPTPGPFTNGMMQYVTTAGVQGICPSGWHIPANAHVLAMLQQPFSLAHSGMIEHCDRLLPNLVNGWICCIFAE